MKFTIVFRSYESYDVSYGLVFIPCPVWIQGKREIINLNPEFPEYKIGSVKRLIKTEKIKEHLTKEIRDCTLIVYPEGNGTKNDLENLEKDLEQEGFVVKKVELCDGEGINIGVGNRMEEITDDNPSVEECKIAIKSVWDELSCEQKEILIYTYKNRGGTVKELAMHMKRDNELSFWKVYGEMARKIYNALGKNYDHREYISNLLWEFEENPGDSGIMILRPQFAKALEELNLV